MVTTHPSNSPLPHRPAPVVRSKNKSGKGFAYLLLAVGSAGALAGGAVIARGFVRTEAKTQKLVPTEDLSAWWNAPLQIKVGDTTKSLSWEALGFSLNNEPMVAGDDPGFHDPLRFDMAKLEKAVADLKASTERPAKNARLDLESREVVKDQSGVVLDSAQTMTAIMLAARQHESNIEVPLEQFPARITTKELGIEDISQVLSRTQTNFKVTDYDRNHNLKLAASHLNGLVIQPGQEISFNQVVGERTEKQGYRIAHVIAAGEMVDGLAGGTCQISTTLFGAAFYAGLDIVSATTHSRPLAYAPVAMDATVVYGMTDLKLRNPFDFPVVVHYRVTQGESVVEILGKEKVYDDVTFSKKVIKSTPNKTEFREDPTIASGKQKVEQKGMAGTELIRYRKLIKDGKTVRTDNWRVTYQPVVHYVRVAPGEVPAVGAAAVTNTLSDPEKSNPFARSLFTPTSTTNTNAPVATPTSR